MANMMMTIMCTGMPNNGYSDSLAKLLPRAVPKLIPLEVVVDFVDDI